MDRHFLVRSTWCIISAILVKGTSNLSEPKITYYHRHPSPSKDTWTFCCHVLTKWTWGLDFYLFIHSSFRPFHTEQSSLVHFHFPLPLSMSRTRRPSCTIRFIIPVLCLPCDIISRCDSCCHQDLVQQPATAQRRNLSLVIILWRRTSCWLAGWLVSWMDGWLTGWLAVATRVLSCPLADSNMGAYINTVPVNTEYNPKCEMNDWTDFGRECSYTFNYMSCISIGSSQLRRRSVIPRQKWNWRMDMLILDVLLASRGLVLGRRREMGGWLVRMWN